MMKWPSMMLWLRSFKEFFESDVLVIAGHGSHKTESVLDS